MANESWHLDKRVPITLIFALLAQTAGMIWWAASISGTVNTHSRDIATLQTDASVTRNAAQIQAVQLARIEEQITGLRGDIGRLITVFERARP